MKTGGWGGSGEHAKADGEEVPQEPTASGGNANLTLSCSCHLLTSGTQRDSARFFPPPFTPSMWETTSRKTKKRLKCLNQEADEPAEFSLYVQQKHREPSLREAPGLLPGQGKGPCSPLPALSIRASCNSSELKGSLLSTIRSRGLSDYSLNTQGPPGTTSLLFP